MPWNLYFSHKIWDDVTGVFFLLWKDNTGTSLTTMPLHFSNAWLIIFHLFLWLPFCFPNTRYMHWFQHNVLNKLLPVTFFQHYWICLRSTHSGLIMFTKVPQQQLLIHEADEEVWWKRQDCSLRQRMQRWWHSLQSEESGDTVEVFRCEYIFQLSDGREGIMVKQQRRRSKFTQWKISFSSIFFIYPRAIFSSLYDTCTYIHGTFICWCHPLPPLL